MEDKSNNLDNRIWGEPIISRFIEEWKQTELYQEASKSISNPRTIPNTENTIIESIEEAVKALGPIPKRQYLSIGWLDYPKVFEIYRGHDNAHIIKANNSGYTGCIIPGSIEVRIDHEKPFGFELKDV